MNRKKNLVLLTVVLLLAFTAAGCSTQTDESADVNNTSRAEAVTNWNGEAATSILLNGTTATITGDGAVADGSKVTINAAGIYVMSGEFTGSVLITATANDDVQLVLNGVALTGDANAAIYCTQADHLTITLADGTENTVADASGYTFTDTVNEEPDAAIFSKNDLIIEGGGSLTVNAGYKNGIGTKDDLTISGGKYTITAANDGLRGRDSVTVTDGELNINAVADGIQSNNDEDAAKGHITLEGGSTTITAGYDGIQAETALTIFGGSYTINTGGGNEADPADTTGSYKGLKAKTDLNVTGGTFAIDSADDTIHTNGNIAISGGSFTLASGDDGVHADGDLTIGGAGTKIDITTCYEGLEAKTMTINDGTITIVSTDDGINIAGGSDSNMPPGGGFGGDHFANVSGDQWLKINGGTITVRAGSDAIDINGNGEMTGGVVDLEAAMLGEGETLDVDGTWTKTGGELTETGGNSPGGGFGGFGGQPGGRQ